MKLLSALLFHMVDIHDFPILLCNDLNMKRNGHSFEDAEILMTICKSKSEIFNQQYGFTFENILHHLDQKLPLPIQIQIQYQYQYRCTIWTLVVHRIKS